MAGSPGTGTAPRPRPEAAWGAAAKESGQRNQLTPSSMKLWFLMETSPVST